LSISTVAIAIVLLAIIAGRFISERSIRALSEDQKRSVHEAFARYRHYFFLPGLALLATYFVAIRLFPGGVARVSAAYFAILFAYITVTNIVMMREFARMELPKSYRTGFLTSRAVSYIGIGVFLYAMVIAPLFR